MKLPARAAVIAALCLFSVGAHAATCAPAATLLAAAADRYGEHPAYSATVQGVPATVTVNAESGSWTLFLAPAPDVLCVAASGEGWKAAEATPQAPPAAPEAAPVPVPQMWRFGQPPKRTWVLPVADRGGL